MNTKKHWPSMFKCKSAASTEGQLHETSPVSAMRPQFPGDASSPHYGQERERSPPKSRPRWNPQPAQIQILESIFNSGMLNPPREEIKRIRAKIEEFGQVSEASVFYWFQNRKSRTKRFKQRQRQAAQKSVTLQTGTLTAGTQTGTLSPSSSTPYTATTSYVQSKPITELACSPVNSIHSTIENQPTPSSSVVPASSFAGHHDDLQLMIEEMRIYNELMNMQAVEAAVVAEGDRGIVNEAGTAAVQQSWCAGTGGLPQEPISNAAHPLITVFIDDRPIEIPMGPINFRAYFGDNSVLIHSSGQLVMVNEWGFIPEGLEHGATYFLL